MVQLHLASIIPKVLGLNLASLELASRYWRALGTQTLEVNLKKTNVRFSFREPETKLGPDKESKPESVESEKPKPDQPEKTVPPLRINLLNLQKRTNGVEPETARSKKDEADLKAETKNPDPEISFSPDEQPEPEPEPEVEKSDEPPEMETEDVVAAEVDKDEHSEPEAAQLESDDLAKKRYLQTFQKVLAIQL